MVLPQGFGASNVYRGGASHQGLPRPCSRFLHLKSRGTGCGRVKDAHALLRRPPSLAKTSPGPWPLRWAELLRAGRQAILMAVKAPQAPFVVVKALWRRNAAKTPVFRHCFLASSRLLEPGPFCALALCAGGVLPLRCLRGAGQFLTPRHKALFSLRHPGKRRAFCVQTAARQWRGRARRERNTPRKPLFAFAKKCARCGNEEKQ